MMYFFDFKSKDDEIKGKLESLNLNPGNVVPYLLEILKEYGASLLELEEINIFCKRLLSLPFNQVYPNYMTHPLRVAGAITLYRRKYIGWETKLCLVHNMIEAGLEEIVDPENRFLESKTRGQVVLLTIDRNLEYNPSYLKGYYQNLAKHNLLAIKSMDKIDNYLSYPIYDVNQQRHDIVFKYLCPLLSEKHNLLRNYLKELVDYIRKPEVKKHYQKYQILVVKQ